LGSGQLLFMGIPASPPSYAPIFPFYHPHAPDFFLSLSEAGVFKCSRWSTILAAINLLQTCHVIPEPLLLQVLRVLSQGADLTRWKRQTNG